MRDEWQIQPLWALPPGGRSEWLEGLAERMPTARNIASDGRLIEWSWSSRLLRAYLDDATGDDRPEFPEGASLCEPLSSLTDRASEQRPIDATGLVRHAVVIAHLLRVSASYSDLLAGVPRHGPKTGQYDDRGHGPWAESGPLAKSVDDHRRNDQCRLAVEAGSMLNALRRVVEFGAVVIGDAAGKLQIKLPAGTAQWRVGSAFAATAHEAAFRLASELNTIFRTPLGKSLLTKGQDTTSGDNADPESAGQLLRWDSVRSLCADVGPDTETTKATLHKLADEARMLTEPHDLTADPYWGCRLSLDSPSHTVILNGKRTKVESIAAFQIFEALYKSGNAGMTRGGLEKEVRGIGGRRIRDLIDQLPSPLPNLIKCGRGPHSRYRIILP
jgi:hypothetical protein